MSQKNELDPRWFDAVTPEIKDEVLDRAVDGEITCAAARNLAEELEVPYQVLGAACNVAEIRVKNCSLGCF
ncbi:MAG: hypothetical protein FWE87_01660 [Coriobacteriia bacterium]|nr:hypothetical protein [Coriobacteriia bacterium]